MNYKHTRIEWIDIAKGIAIFLMVCGHTGIPQNISRFIWSFHMPLFFIISGFLFDSEKYFDIRTLIRKRIKTLVIPYITFSIIAFIGLYPLDLAGFEELYKGWKGYALWFIPVLFMTEILFNRIYVGLNKIEIKNNYVLETTVLICSAIGYILSLCDIHYFFKFEVIFFSIFFYGTGFVFKQFLLNIGLKQKWWILSLISQIIIVQFIPPIDMAANQYGWYLPNLLIALWGTINIILVAKHMLSWESSNIIKRLLIWAGKNTLIIMGLSQVINMTIKTILLITFISPITNSIIRHCLLWGMLYACSIILNTHAPFLIGRKRSVQ